MKKVLDYSVNIALLGGLVLVVSLPDGIARTKYRNWQESRSTQRAVAENWADLVSAGERIGIREPDSTTLVIFADYQCSYCRMAQDTLSRVLEQHPETSVVYRHFPLTRSNTYSDAAARASICAGHQGHFPALNAFLYDTSEWREAGADWIQVAAQLGLSEPGAFITCLDSDATTARLAEDLRLARLLNVRSTPTFVSRNGVNRGLMTQKELLSILGLSPL
jgi:protein-disulfide isomerase